MKNANTKKFEKDLDFGEHFEMASVNFITEFFNKKLIVNEKKLLFLGQNNGTSTTELKKYDLKFGIFPLTGAIEAERIITFEIKTDKYDSANVFFEKSCSKKPSGVYATEADYFIYILPRYTEKNFYIIKPVDLINLLDKGDYHLSIGVGDGKRVNGFLINRLDFEKDFVQNKGKLLDNKYIIPDKYNLTMLSSTSTNNNKNVVTVDKIKKYDNPMDWLNS